MYQCQKSANEKASLTVLNSTVVRGKAKAEPQEHNKSTTRQKWHLVGFTIALVLIFFLVFQTIYKIEYSAVGLYFEYASKVLEGQLPYRDFVLEYPPVALLFFILPRLAATTFPLFSILFQIEVLICSLIGLYVIYKIALRLGKAPWKIMGVYTLCILAIGPIIAQQFDIFPAVTVLLALYCFWTGRHKTSWALLAIGALTKIYPVVIAPIFIIYYLRNQQYSRIWQGALVFGAICLAAVLPFFITGPENILSLLSYHAAEGTSD